MHPPPRPSHAGSRLTDSPNARSPRVHRSPRHACRDGVPLPRPGTGRGRTAEGGSVVQGGRRRVPQEALPRVPLRREGESRSRARQVPGRCGSSQGPQDLAPRAGHTEGRRDAAPGQAATDRRGTGCVHQASKPRIRDARPHRQARPRPGDDAAAQPQRVQQHHSRPRRDRLQPGGGLPVGRRGPRVR